ncbi:hypothetical protein [Burkholderia cepacia]|uniref:hypothetical protein n=1 Tax=Burkholderia cepacia TaxID=292 RepID=UPI000A722307|nr:hypothetical protein [Burkholderia cepacia]
MLTPIVGGADFCHLDDVLEPGDRRTFAARVDHLTDKDHELGYACNTLHCADVAPGR